MTQSIQLAPPGAGIPWLQKMMARYYLLPKSMKKTTEEQALQYFQSEGEKILHIIRETEPAKLTEPFLIPPMEGLEDSSRLWSIAMTAEHLVIVGTHIAEIVVELSFGRVPGVRVDTAAVKPKGEWTTEETGPRFEQFLTDYQVKVAERSQPMNTHSRLDHPWFGPYTAHQWFCLASIHQRLHRKQIELIRAGIGS